MKIQNESQLRELYAQPMERAVKKVMSKLDIHARNFIEKSPFLTLSTVDQDGNMDVSPRGGQVGFTKVLDDTHLAIPDSKGNNRLDSLSNIVNTGRVGSLFLIPGMDETLRVNGSAYLTTDAEILDLFDSEKNPPKTCIILEVEETFLHCAKALMRSRLWADDARMERSDMPTMGQMLKDQIGSKEQPESQEDMVKRYQKDL